jgi:O-antigen/teichoic acid export membrane protein
VSDGLGRNFLFLTAGNVLGPVFSMLLVLAISRLRGMEMLGQYSLLMTVFVVGQSCASLGLPVIVTREVARARERAGRYFVNASLIGVTAMVACVAALALAAWAVGSERDMSLALGLTVLSLVPSATLANGDAVLLAFGRAEDSVGVALAENAARAIVGTALVLAGSGIVAVAAAMLALRLAAALVQVLVLRRRGVVLTAEVDRPLCQSLLRELPVVGTIPIVNQLYVRADIFLLTWLGTWRDVGLYSAGLRLVDLGRTVPAAYGRALYPVLARAHAGRATDFRAQVCRAVRHVLLLIAPMVVVLGGFAPILVTGVFGADAAGAEASLAVLAWTLVPLGLACVLAQVLFAAGRQAADLRTNVIATVASVLANAVLIPRFGAVGAAAAMLGSMTLYAALQYRWVVAYVLDPRMLGFVGRLVAVVAVGVAAAVAAVGGDHLFVAAVLAASITFVGALLAGVITRDELEHVWQRAVAGRRWLLGER